MHRIPTANRRLKTSPFTTLLTMLAQKEICGFVFVLCYALALPASITIYSDREIKSCFSEFMKSANIAKTYKDAEEIPDAQLEARSPLKGLPNCPQMSEWQSETEPCIFVNTYNELFKDFLNKSKSSETIHTMLSNIVNRANKFILCANCATNNITDPSDDPYARTMFYYQVFKHFDNCRHQQ